MSLHRLPFSELIGLAQCSNLTYRTENFLEQDLCFVIIELEPCSICSTVFGVYDQISKICRAREPFSQCIKLSTEKPRARGIYLKKRRTLEQTLYIIYLYNNNNKKNNNLAHSTSPISVLYVKLKK